MTINIIEVRKKDAGAAVSLGVILGQYLSEVGLPNVANIASSVGSALAGGTRAWVAMDGTTPVGCIAVRPRGEMTRGYVLPDYRGQGIGGDLINYALAAGGWWTTTDKDNEPVNDHLAYLGWHCVGPKEPNTDQYLMWVMPDPNAATVL